MDNVGIRVKHRSIAQSTRLLTSNNFHLDHAHICILHTNPHVAPAWISHQARQGFLHGNFLLFSFCIGRDGTCDSCIAIHQA